MNDTDPVSDPERGTWFGHRVEPGTWSNLDLTISRSYSGAPVKIPLQVWRGERPGPTCFITAAVHGDEINGTGLVRSVILERPFELRAGTLVLVPVVNLLGFERHSRYLPDRRDLNRCFPGTTSGSLARRMARVLFQNIVRPSDFGLDLHTAAIRRTNFPNVRADLSTPAVARLARATGAELIVDSTGPQGSLRREACRAGVPTVVIEAGEVWKTEPAVLDYMLQVLQSLLSFHDMIDAPRTTPTFRTVVKKTVWVRAEHGGFLRFHVAPGSVVEPDQPLATNTSLRGRSQNVLRAPRGGVVIGMTTIPAVSPGDPVVHIAVPEQDISKVDRAVQELDSSSALGRVKRDLATNLAVEKPHDDRPPGHAGQ